MPESVAANMRGRSFRILAEVTIGTPEASGVIFAHGSRFGGHALFLKDQKLWYVYNFLGIPPEQQFVSDVLQPGKYVLGMEFTKESMGQYHEAIGTTKLYVNDEVVATGPMRTQIGMFTLCGDGLCVGRDSARRRQRRVHVAVPLQWRHDPPGRGQRRRRPVHRPREGRRGDAGPRVGRSDKDRQELAMAEPMAEGGRIVRPQHFRPRPAG